MRHEERGEVFDDVGKCAGLKRHVFDERIPLRDFRSVFREGSCQGVGRLFRNFSLASCEGCGDGPRKLAASSEITLTAANAESLIEVLNKTAR